MGERKGVNKYYPPDYDPSKGGLNKWQGTHALRERAKKLHLGILVIRFEMPYNIWCDGCENHIGTGVRYNAEKKKVGMYYTTPVYEFRMKCHLCDNYFEIRTDPANLDYEITSGARRQERRWDPSENEQVAPEDKAVGRKMAVDAMYRREHGAEDRTKSAHLDPVIRDLEDLQESRWEDDFSANQLLRQKFRASENAIKAQERRDAAHNLSVALLPPSQEDASTAALMAITMKAVDSSAEKQKLLDTQSVFTKLKPKRLSKAVKKDIAKQSIHNIVAASTQNFDTFTNTFDKRLCAVVKKKNRSKRFDDKHPEDSNSKSANVVGHGRPEWCEASNGNVVSAGGDGLCESSDSSSEGSGSATCSTADTSNSHLSSPVSDRSLLSPSPEISSDACLPSRDALASLPSTAKRNKTKIKLPSVTFGVGKEVLNFITDTGRNITNTNNSKLVFNNQNRAKNTYIEDPSGCTHDSSHNNQSINSCNISPDKANTSGKETISNLSGLLVDYSGSDSDEC